MGVTDLALTCGSEPVMDAVCTAVVGSARTGRVLDAGIISAESCHIATFSCYFFFLSQSFAFSDELWYLFISTLHRQHHTIHI